MHSCSPNLDMKRCAPRVSEMRIPCSCSQWIILTDCPHLHHYRSRLFHPAPGHHLLHRQTAQSIPTRHVHEGTGVDSATEACALEYELHAPRLYLLVEVKIFEVFHACRVKHVAEISQSLDVHALALRHARVHHARNVAQHGLNIRVTHCGDFRQILCDGLRFHGLPLHYGLGIVNALLLLKCFLLKWHSLINWLMNNVYCLTWMPFRHLFCCCLNRLPPLFSQSATSRMQKCQ